MSLSTRTRKFVGSAAMLVSVGALALTGMASVAAQANPGGDDAETSAEVDTKELCIWYVDGVAGEVALLPAAGAEVKYDGTEMDLTSGTSMEDVLVFVSGNDPAGVGDGTIDAHRDCTFYGAAEGISFKAELEAGGFTAASGLNVDGDMAFAMTGDNPFEYTVEGTCRSGATGAADPDLWVVDGLSATDALGVLAQDIALLSKANTYPQQSDTNAQNSACSVSQAVTVSVPADLTPQYPGTDYTFTGPTLTFSFVIQS